MSLKLNLILNKTKNNVIGIDNKLLFKIHTITLSKTDINGLC